MNNQENTKKNTLNKTKDVNKNIVAEMEKETSEEYTYISDNKEFLNLLNNLLSSNTDTLKIEEEVEELKKVHNEYLKTQEKEYLEKFLSEGGKQENFSFVLDKTSIEFENIYNEYKKLLLLFLKNNEKTKENTPKKRNELLDALRILVSEIDTNPTESYNILQKVKKIEEQWKAIEISTEKPNKILLANYKALREMFYKKINFFYELKDLDKKKNKELKIKLCEKAEKLKDHPHIQQAVTQLSKIQHEFFQISAITQEEKISIENRFKLISDEIHNKKRDYFKTLKIKEEEIITQKTKILNTLIEINTIPTEYTNTEPQNKEIFLKTWRKNILNVPKLQEEWEKIETLKTNKENKIEKKYREQIYLFFKNKQQCLKSLEADVPKNIEIKTQLVEQINYITDNITKENIEEFTQKVTEIQKKWKEIIIVPYEKKLKKIIENYTQACNDFYAKRKSFLLPEYYEEQNLKKKEAICEKLLQIISKTPPDIDTLEKLITDYKNIRQVPKNKLEHIKKKYKDTTELIMKAIEKEDESSLKRIKNVIKQYSDVKQHSNVKQYSDLKHTQNQNFSDTSNKNNNQNNYNRKENQQKISQLEKDIRTWELNLERLSKSAASQKIKIETEKKIESAKKEIEKFRNK